MFSCDPTGNLVHFDRLEPKGATFSAQPAHTGVEFLASTDNWFRPVFLAHGPDGALYVCDMYRKTIEHPDYLPDEIRKRTDFESGKTMGRIWRVVRDDAQPEEMRRHRRVDLGGVSIARLCEQLRNPDGWWCDTAHRLLLEHRDRAAVGPLRSIVADPRSSPVAVVHALRLLEALDALSDDLLRPALRHRTAPVREHALQLLETRLAREPGWLADVLPLAGDEDARVRFQAAIVLGAAGDGPESPRARAEDRHTEGGVAAALARIAARDGLDRWARAAVFSSLTGRELGFLTALGALPRGENRLQPELLSELGRLLGASQPKETWAGLVRRIVDAGPGFTSEERAALLTGLAEAAQGRLASRGTGDVLSAVIGPASEQSDLMGSIRDLVAAMKQIAEDPTQPVARRVSAVRLLAFAGFDQVGQTLLRLVDPEQPSTLQAAAVRALGSHHDDRVATSLLAAGHFATYPPSLRDEVLSTLIAQSHHLGGLLAAMEDGRVPTGAIDALHRRELTQHRDPAIRRRAASSSEPSRGTGPRSTRRTRTSSPRRPTPGAVARSSGVSAPRATDWTRRVTPSGLTSSASATSPSRQSCSTCSCPITRSRKGSRPIPSRPRTGACSRGSSPRKRPRASRSASRSARRTPSSERRSTKSRRVRNP